MNFIKVNHIDTGDPKWLNIDNIIALEIYTLSAEKGTRILCGENHYFPVRQTVEEIESEINRIRRLNRNLIA